MSRIKLGQSGSVYVLTNASLAEGVLKIGATTDDPIIRAKQLSAATAAATPFVVAYSRHVSDVNEIEARMHDRFNEERLNDSREFFKIPLHKAIVALDEMAGEDYWGPKVETPFAEMFASFPDDGTARELTPEEAAQCRQLERRQTTVTPGTVDKFGRWQSDKDRLVGMSLR